MVCLDLISIRDVNFMKCLLKTYWHAWPVCSLQIICYKLMDYLMLQILHTWIHYCTPCKANKLDYVAWFAPFNLQNFNPMEWFNYRFQNAFPPKRMVGMELLEIMAKVVYITYLVLAISHIRSVDAGFCGKRHKKISNILQSRNRAQVKM